jgi:ABC-type antimicrobial peptide transport system permease subunit
MRPFDTIFSVRDKFSPKYSAAVSVDYFHGFADLSIELLRQLVFIMLAVGGFCMILGLIATGVVVIFHVIDAIKKAIR